MQLSDDKKMMINERKLDKSSFKYLFLVDQFI